MLRAVTQTQSRPLGLSDLPKGHTHTLTLTLTLRVSVSVSVSVRARGPYCNSTAVHPRPFELSLPQRLRDGQPGGTNRGKKSADQPDASRPKDGVDQKLRRDGEGKGDLAERLPVDG